MNAIGISKGIVLVCFLVFGGVIAVSAVGNTPSLAEMLDLAAVLSFLLGLALSPQVMFGRVTLMAPVGQSTPETSADVSGFSRLPKPLRLGIAGFAIFYLASFIATHL